MMPDTLTEAELKNRFSYHPPRGTQPERYIDIRSKALEFAMMIRDLCPNSRERSVALTELESCVMWANASIARNEGTSLTPSAPVLVPATAHPPPRPSA